MTNHLDNIDGRLAGVTEEYDNRDVDDIRWIMTRQNNAADVFTKSGWDAIFKKLGIQNIRIEAIHSAMCEATQI